MVVCKWVWYCDKMAEWIQMNVIGVLNFGGNRRRGRGIFSRGMFGTFHCNQWDCLREGQ